MSSVAKRSAVGCRNQLDRRIIALRIIGTRAPKLVDEDQGPEVMQDEQIVEDENEYYYDADEEILPGEVVGIDLGTTNSAIALLREGKPEIVASSDGGFITPSVVAFSEDGSILVGADAVEQSAANAANTVHCAKRFIGRPFKVCKNYAKRAVVEVAEDAE
eukprot:CAMPEP_0169196892 /NCGR_PEP_ID=MMETSP1016-20121227/7975_1 /TAXON_ID=342587 /ORGANISM="Karlodinium micrum, Strain CCMP2283" /LENGTH=160 /DNA_ID=CAMNT_0009273499 /DNA_START=150 /DNA_END=629 /DNA_ORIENTATION=+